MPIRNTLSIMYEDADIIVCHKPAGIATQTKNPRELDMVDLIKRHLYKNATQNTVQNNSGSPYLAVIHRLDQPVSGILVFAKTPAAAKQLNLQLQSHGFGKHYKALLTHCPDETLCNQPLVNYMKKDVRTNTSSICTKNDPLGKKAILNFNIISSPTEEDFALFSHCNLSSDNLSILALLTAVEIILETGRHHQIRVQMSHIGCPIFGDAKYGTVTQNWEQIALCAYKLEFKHPTTKKELRFLLP